MKDPEAKFLDKLPAAIEDVLSRHREAEAVRGVSEDLNRWPHELKQRVKELSCLFGMEKLCATEGESLEPVFQGVANLIPRACRHDTICCARIRVRNQEFLSDNFRETQWRKSFVLKEFGAPIGSIDVGYTENPPGTEREIFSPEEQELFHSISDRLSQFIDRWRTWGRLHQIHEELRNAVLILSAEIAGCETEDAICRVVVEGIRSRMGIDRCGLFLGDPNHPPFRGTYGTDMNGQTTQEHNHTWHIAKERDVADLFKAGSYKTGFPLGAPEIQPGEEGLHSTLIALRQGGKGDIFGVISVDNRITRRPVSEAQMVHIALLAEVLGNALQIARARGALRDAVEETKRANAELEEFNRALVGREGRVIELKEEVNRLLAELGRPPQYPPVWKEAEENAPSAAPEKK